MRIMMYSTMEDCDAGLLEPFLRRGVRVGEMVSYLYRLQAESEAHGAGRQVVR